MDLEQKTQIEEVKTVVKKPIYYKIQFILIAIFAFIIWLLLYLISEKIYYRSSSLSPGTLKLINKLSDYLDITVALSVSKLPEQAEFYKRTIFDLVNEFKLSSIKVRTQIIDPDDPKYAKESEPIKKKVEKQTMRKVGSGEFSMTEIYNALLISYQDKSDVIYIDLDNLERLEYEIAFRIQKFLQGGKKFKIAYIEGHNERDIHKDYGNIRSLIEKSYDITDFNFTEQKKYNLAGFDIVIIMGPLKDFSYKELIAIDQYIMSGGNLIVMYDGMDIPRQPFVGVPIKNEKLQEFLEYLGVKINNDLVFDLNCELIQVRQERGDRIYNYGLWIKIDRTNFNSDIVFLKDIAFIFWPWGSTVDILKNNQPNVKKEILFTTTEYGIDIKDETNIDPSKYTHYFRQFNKDEQEYKRIYKSDKKVLGAYLVGKFSSFFANKKDLPIDVMKTIENFEGGIKKEGEKNANVIILGNSKFLNNQFISEESTVGNAVFFLNLLDWLMQSDELREVRTKGLGISLIRQDLTYPDRLKLTIFGSFTMPVIFLIFGFTVALIRKVSKKIVYQ